LKFFVLGKNFGAWGPGPPPLWRSAPASFHSFLKTNTNKKRAITFVD